MAKYLFNVIREVTEFTPVEIDAASEADAIEKGIAHAQTLSSCCWEREFDVCPMDHFVREDDEIKVK